MASKLVVAWILMCLWTAPTTATVPPINNRNTYPQYNITLAVKQSLPVSYHTLIITSSAAMYFDYVMINETDSALLANTSATSSASAPTYLPLSSQSSTSPIPRWIKFSCGRWCEFYFLFSSSRFPVKAVAGGIARGLVVVTVIICALLFWRRQASWPVRICSQSNVLSLDPFHTRPSQSLDQLADEQPGHVRLSIPIPDMAALLMGRIHEGRIPGEGSVSPPSLRQGDTTTKLPPRYME